MPYRDCILYARSLQRTIWEECSEDNKELHDLIFKGESDSGSNSGNGD